MQQVLVSVCCMAEVGFVPVRENPLGRREYNGLGITYSVPVCSNCRRVANVRLVQRCEYCGAVSDPGSAPHSHEGVLQYAAQPH